MNDTLDYYQLLHVHPDAPAEIIKASYRALMQALKQHPDLGGDHDRAALINQAYATLTDANKRRDYDAKRSRAGQRPLQTGPSGDHAGVTNRAARPARRQRCEFCALPYARPASMGDVIGADALCERCSSPLRPSVKLQTDSAGQRALERYPKRAPVQIWARWDGPEYEALSLDLSLRGMLLETTTELHAAQRIRIACDLCQAVGKVVHLRAIANRWQVGIEFQTLRFLQMRGSFVSTEA